MEDQGLQVVEERQIAALGTEKPASIIDRAVEIADVLAPIIRQKNLFKRIGDKDHVMAEGWAVLMGLINVDPVVDFSRKIEREGEVAYEARVSLVHNGRVVAAAETIASDKEKTAWSRSEQGVKSMAQTRAFGKACRLKYSWIMVMAGYAPTPVEEMPDERPTIQTPKAKSATNGEGSVSPALPPSATTGSKVISDKQRKFLWAKCRAANISEESFKKYIKEEWLTEHSAELPWQAMDPILKWIDTHAVAAKA
jgi:hypothetical protein